MTNEPPSPIRIAFCITELDPGGAERALVELVTRLDRQQFEPKVFCLGPRAELVEPLEQAGVSCVCLGAKRKRDLWVLPRLVRELRTFHPAILQTWLFHANLMGRWAARWAGVPIVVSGIRVAERRSRSRLWAERLTQRRVKAHVCVSHDVAKFSIEQGGLDRARVMVIPNGVDADRFAQVPPADLSEWNIPADGKTILFVGRLDPQKDPLWLLEAFPRIRNRVGHVHLLYVGRGVLEAELIEEIRRRDLDDVVHVLGRREDVPALLKAADVFVLPSRWEGQPNVLLEACAAGVPVVSTAVEGVSDFLIHGETGLLVQSRDAEELANRVVEILSDPPRASELARSAQLLVIEKFTWDANAEAYRNLYQDLLEKHRHE